MKTHISGASAHLRALISGRFSALETLISAEPSDSKAFISGDFVEICVLSVEELKKYPFSKQIASFFHTIISRRNFAPNRQPSFVIEGRRNAER